MSEGEKSQRDMAHRLVALLMRYPKAGDEIARGMESLEFDVSTDLGIVIELAALLRHNPSYTMNHVLSFWRRMYGGEQGDRLARIAVTGDLLDRASAKGGHLAEIRGIIARLHAISGKTALKMAPR